MDRQAITKYELNNGKFHATVIIGPTEDVNEFLITLNHELIHYLSFKERVHLITNPNKLSNCLTPYQLETLKDETSAFKAEISFWENSPSEFKKDFKDKTFESKLLNLKSDYAGYYSKLKANLKKEPNYILQRYIDLGEYPKCALKLL